MDVGWGKILEVLLEGKREINKVEFYTQKLDGEPLPNDDLDLQLVWLAAAEIKGLYQLTPRVFGEFWLSHIPCPSGEYSVCRANIANGLYPPLSGACNNEHLKFSNGAWIRSEIWACLFPGTPDEAIKFAYMDSCADHVGEGIYAEMFTTALESAAFVESDIRRLIEIGLSKIPSDCHVARSVKIACNSYDKGKDWEIARKGIVEDNLKHLGWFQAPANIAFMVVGLLYGEGDFSKTICRAVNCGDDADCTAATAGSIMGIIIGLKNIPEKWIKPIGDRIVTIAIKAPAMAATPLTVNELTDRTVRLAKVASLENRTLPRFSDQPTSIPAGYSKTLLSNKYASVIWAKSPYDLEYDLGYAKIAINYADGPSMKSGEKKRLSLKLRMYDASVNQIFYKWKLPEGWNITPEFSTVIIKNWWESIAEYELVAGEFSEAYEYLTLEVRLAGRNIPICLSIPIELKDCAVYPRILVDYPLFAETRNRITGRIVD